MNLRTCTICDKPLEQGDPIYMDHTGARHQRCEADPVNHPAHYTGHPSGVECIQITEHMNFNLGNAVKYIWRAGDKGDAIQDLQKAAWYVQREIDRLAPPETETVTAWGGEPIATIKGDGSPR